MNLYEIDNAILDCVDTETGEIFDVDKFESLNLERDAKVENICLWIKNLKAEAEALKAEKAAFDQRQKSCERKMESLKKYITQYLDGTSFKSTKVNVTFRKSEAVDIDDSAIIPEEYLRYKAAEVDKVAIKMALKMGKSIDGCSIVEKYNIQIK